MHMHLLYERHVRLLCELHILCPRLTRSFHPMCPNISWRMRALSHGLWIRNLKRTCLFKIAFSCYHHVRMAWSSIWNKFVGGGAIEMELSKYLRDYSRTIAGKEQLLISCMAKALEVIPRQLCDNAGFDATNVLNKLRQKHAQGSSSCWIIKYFIFLVVFMYSKKRQTKKYSIIIGL